MIDESNPAGRLHKILTEAKKQDENLRVQEVWAKATGVENEDVIVTKAVVELYTLSQEVQALIKMNDGLNQKLYLGSFKTIDAAFFPLNLASNWKGSKNRLTDEALTRLQFCAEQLESFYSEESLSPEELNDIIKRTNDLFDALLKSNMPSELRMTLLEEVERIRNAINMYRIKGAKGLKEALQGTIGAIIANDEELKKAAPEFLTIIKKLGDLVVKLDSFTTKALKLKKALTNPIKYVLEKMTDEDPSESEQESADA